MIPRILSIASPLWVYASLAVVIYGLWQSRRKFDWLALAPAAAGLAASAFLLTPVHRLFFDEDIYIGIANNLTHAPVNQITLFGGPHDVQASSYYKEPAGWPVFLSLVFLVTGRGETAAFWVARVLYAAAIAAVYHLALEALGTRRQALLASVIFGATPICFWFSVSAGTDIPAALCAALGLWGLIGGNEALAVGGFALAAQTRMELLLLVPLVWLSNKMSFKWRAAAAGLVSIEVVHVVWVMSVAPVLAHAERVGSTFSLGYVWANSKANVTYLFNPYGFFAVMTALMIGAVYKGRSAPRFQPSGFLAMQAGGILMVYLLFYAGSFDLNPRYSIQMLAPIAVLAASLMKGRLAVLMLSLVLPYTRPYDVPGFAQALISDHRMSVRFAARTDPGDLIVSAEPEVFLNQDRRAMNAVYASERKEKLEEEIRRRKVWYHSGVRTNVENSEEWMADRWVKSNFELHLIDSQEVSGMRTAFYEVLLKPVDREARLRRTLECESDRCERG